MFLGRLMAYEAPMDGNFGTGRWRAHVLAEWTSKTKYYLISPRSAALFYPKDARMLVFEYLLKINSSKRWDFKSCFAENILR